MASGGSRFRRDFQLLKKCPHKGSCFAEDKKAILWFRRDTYSSQGIRLGFPYNKKGSYGHRPPGLTLVVHFLPHSLQHN